MVEIEYEFGDRELVFMEDFYKRVVFKKIKIEILVKLGFLILPIMILVIINGIGGVLYKNNLSFFAVMIFIFSFLLFFKIIKEIYLETTEFLKLKKYIQESLNYLKSVKKFKAVIGSKELLVDVDGNEERINWNNYSSYAANDDIIYLNSKNDRPFFLLKSAISPEDFEKAKQIIITKIPNG